MHLQLFLSEALFPQSKKSVTNFNMQEKLSLE
jgi:hypothetical protein